MLLNALISVVVIIVSVVIIIDNVAWRCAENKVR